MSAYKICKLLIQLGRTDGLQAKVNMFYACGQLTDARCKSNQHRLDDVERRQELAPIEFGGTMEKV